MSVGFPPVGGASQAGNVPEPDRELPTKGGDFAANLERASAAEPPPEVQAEVRAAARCANHLYEMGRRLSFELDSDSGRIRVEVRDLDGNVLRRIPLTEALEIAAGAPVD